MHLYDYEFSDLDTFGLGKHMEWTSCVQYKSEVSQEIYTVQRHNLLPAVT